MSKKFSELLAAMSLQARSQASELAQNMLNEMPPHGLHRAQELSKSKRDDHSTPKALNAASTGSE